MTTAHRPTFDPARGKDAQRGPAYHQRLLPAHTQLKQRQAGQGGVGGLPDTTGRDLRAELLKAEAAVKARKAGGKAGGVAEIEEPRGEKRKIEGAIEQDEDEETKRRRLILEEAQEVDASSSEDDASSDEESDDEEEEEAELKRELEKVRAERAAQRAAEEAAKTKKEDEEREMDVARGNPLLNGGNRDFGVKRRWDDDVVFKNQARGTEEKGMKREFVNDLLRSDFHKRFMSKYVR